MAGASAGWRSGTPLPSALNTTICAPAAGGAGDRVAS